MMASNTRADSNWGDDHDQHALGRPSGSPARLIALFATLAVVLILVVIVKLSTPPRDPAKEPAVGKRPEKLALTPLDNDADPINLANLQGQVVLLNFWGPWCPPCRAEFPELMELREALAKEDRFHFVSVTATPTEDESDLVKLTKTYLQTQKYDLPVYRDSEHTSRNELQDLNKSRDFPFPTTVLLDQQGVIRAWWTGYSPGVSEQMRELIEKLLKEKSE